MITVTFVEPNGTRHEVESETGSTLMEAAIRNHVPGIIAECGGACTCATCHVYVDAGWAEKAGRPSAMEEDMLDFAFEVSDNSRLSCQVKLSDELSGLIVHVPANQS